VDGLGHQLLARAGFAGDEHGAAAGGGLVDQVEHPQHGLAPADDVVGGELVLQALAQKQVLALGLGVLGGLVHGEHELVVGEGLGDVVQRPELHGLHRALDAAEGGHDDDRDVGIVLFDVLQHLLAGHLGHLHVRDDHVHLGLVEVGEPGLGIVQGRDLIARVHEQGLEDQEIVLLVVKDEYLAWHRGGASGGQGETF